MSKTKKDRNAQTLTVIEQEQQLVMDKFINII